MPRIEEISKGFESGWDGRDLKGSLTDEATKLLNNLEYDIDQNPDTLFNRYEDGGLWEAGAWFQSPVDELKATTTDKEIQTLAELYDSDARGDYVVIAGGSEALAEHFRNQRDEMKEKED